MSQLLLTTEDTESTEGKGYLNFGVFGDFGGSNVFSLRATLVGRDLWAMANLA